MWATWPPGMCGAGLLFGLLAVLAWVTASEFPERECCDLEYPKPQPTVPTSSLATSTTAGTPSAPFLTSDAWLASLPLLIPVKTNIRYDFKCITALLFAEWHVCFRLKYTNTNTKAVIPIFCWSCHCFLRLLELLFIFGNAKKSLRLHGGFGTLLKS